jgi:PDZ domain-containing secreted protein
MWPRCPSGVFGGVATPLGLDWSSEPVEVGPPAPAVGLDFHGTSGSSSGLAGALALVDALGPAPLAAGRRIAVTGTVSPSGEVGPIGGLRQKAVAARRAGATVLVVPTDEVEIARRYAGGLSVVGASTLAHAVEALGGPGCA